MGTNRNRTNGKAPRYYGTWFMQTDDLWTHEKALISRGFECIAGIDEAGRGPLAGPVVSAAVVLPPRCDIRGIADSKKLTARQRDTLFLSIYRKAVAIGIGIVDAARLSMVLAVENLAPRPQYLLIDGNFGLACPLPQQSLIKGDMRCASIAAASIVAKVSRDRLMLRYHADYPQFGFDRHKGYPTAAHRAAIAAHGPSPIHRVSFKGVREHLPGAATDRTVSHGR